MAVRSEATTGLRRVPLAADVRELVHYRELVRNLVARDLKARYKRSVLGFVWSLLNPLLMTGVFYLVFKFLLPSERPAFPLFILSAFLPWNFLASSVTIGLQTIAGNGNLVKKVYFPREVLPLSLVLSNMVNFLLASPLLVLLMLYYQIPLSPLLLLFPVIVLVQLAFVLGVVFFLACVNVYFRDTEMIMEVLMLAWFFLTPIFYDMKEVLPQYTQILYWLNPMASLISTYRLLVYDISVPAPDFLLRTVLTAVVVLVLGYAFFRRFSRNFAEEI